jgi:two-component system chemotaxis response regulator CheY
MKILVADDSKAMRMIVVRTLRQAGLAGHDIIEAQDGKEAFDLARAQDVDLVLSDWNMPGMTGIELLAALRGAGCGVPFCFVTSEGSPQMRDLALRSGAMGLIAKPFTPETFADTLATVVTA